MKYIVNDSLDPYYNLALEEYVLENIKDDDYVLLWQNHNTIVIGRYQNTIEEINADQVKKCQVSVVRRITGGGAVYHDLGNLNFSFISNWCSKKDLTFHRFLNPVINALTEFNINPIIKGRNDLIVDGKKISGNAQAIRGNRILHHGTLLVQSNLSMISRVLKVKRDKIISKGIKSVRNRVVNLQDCTNIAITIPMLKECLLSYLFDNSNIEIVVLTEKQITEIAELRENKYRTWHWNYGESPKSNYINTARFSGGKITISVNIEKGLITQCTFFGDFLALKDMKDITLSLKGVPYNRQIITHVLSRFDLELYFGSISKKEIISLFV